MFIWVCGIHRQPHLVLLDLHESGVMDLIELYLAQVFFMVILLRNYGGGVWLKESSWEMFIIKNCYLVTIAWR